MKYKELGIYIHIPFCKQKCYYCDFSSYANKEELIDTYIKVLKIELEEELNKIIKYNEKNEKNIYNITTIYIGGGTPSVIDKKYINEISEVLKEKIIKINEKKEKEKNIFENIEFTIEVNPGTVNKEKLKLYRQAGINRLSIGLQTINNKLLKQIGRIHTYEEFLDTYNLAKKVGFENINIDLMLGLPNQTILDLKSSVEDVIKLNPNHISIYSLIIEENTVLEKLIKNKEKYKMPDEDLERKMYWYVKNKLELSGYNHYEISNFSKKTKESRHNMNCWEQKEYIGIGSSAHSYLNNTRYSNEEDINNYIENTNQKHIHETQDEIQKQKEYMLIGLRKIEGVSIKKFKEIYTYNPIYIFKDELNKLVNMNLIQIDLDYIKLTNKGIDLANLVWEEFV